VNLLFAFIVDSCDISTVSGCLETGDLISESPQRHQNSNKKPLLVKHEGDHLASSLDTLEEFRRQRKLPPRIEMHAIERRTGESPSHLILNLTAIFIGYDVHGLAHDAQ